MGIVFRILRPFALALWLLAAPAGALPVTVFWDGPTILGKPGYGVSSTTAGTASAAGVPIVQPVGVQVVSGLDENDIGRALDPATLVTTGSPTIISLSITSNWTVHNDTGTPLQNLYLAFERPIANGDVVYAPSDVGLTLGAGWVILQGVASGGVPVYYPAVSLGSVNAGAEVPFPLLYTLHNPPQEFSLPSFNLELGMPAWSLFFVSAPVPEPASGLLVLFGLLGIAVGRRQRG